MGTAEMRICCSKTTYWQYWYQRFVIHKLCERFVIHKYFVLQIPCFRVSLVRRALFFRKAQCRWCKGTPISDILYKLAKPLSAVPIQGRITIDSGGMKKAFSPSLYFPTNIQLVPSHFSIALYGAAYPRLYIVIFTPFMSSFRHQWIWNMGQSLGDTQSLGRK